MVTLQELEQKCREFRENEGRASFYDLAMEAIKDHPVNAAVNLLATWNIGRFKYIISDGKNLARLKEVIRDTAPIRERLAGKKLLETNFDDPEIRGDLITEYLYFSEVPGVEFTGASKVMHLFSPELLVMWDMYIRKIHGVGVSEGDYINFQKMMQDKFRHINWAGNSKPLAKAIDEYNYMTYSYPEVQKQRAKRKYLETIK